MTTLARYRTAMLQRKAAVAGCTVEELLRRGEALVERQLRQYEIRCDRRSAWATIERAARERGRVWIDSNEPGDRRRG